METFNLTGSSRSEIGRKNAKELRNNDQIPCVVYGGKNNVHFSVGQLAIRDLIYTHKFYKVALDVEGDKRECIVKDIQFDPVTDKIKHVDFQELVPGKPVKADIPIFTVGNSIGVFEGGALMQKTRKISVKAKPEDLVGSIEVDVTDLVLGKSIKIGDIDAGNLEILNSPNIPIASVEIPRAVRSAQSAEEAEGEAAEGEATEGEAAEGEAKE